MDDSRKFKPYGRDELNRHKDHRRNDSKGLKEHGRYQGHAREEPYEYTEVLAAANKKAMEVETEEGDWVLNSSCTYHITSKKSWFVDYKLEEGDSVYMGNNNECEIIGRDSILLRLTENKETRVETQTKRKVKYFRTDNGLEFLGNNFNSLCDECGITRHRTVAYTPQQNGVAERMNRTLIDRVRCMLSEAKLPEDFWAEALATTTYPTNRSPTISINMKTTEEMWKGSPPDLSNLKTFGCTVYVQTKQSKVEPRAIKCIFIGYLEGVKGLKCWNFISNRSLISKDVTFKEDEFYMNSETNKQI
ncbi:Retrovirus-related Pol polyprotein from transposon TNT 1-94 [Cucumis melo var. makuwa]|uniref:Retrovirus-related Pol polyprotein from transposon TNT 1-94 n=1 Tax=Cucumis melo var. makuwa TaxID=1194695 RepID=A0A5A7TF17_CUCMM|nr:Retrovirus-related Pol polyprotein from transposon TNT 1-94 [Cucumis melo var. makuwa]